MEGLALQRTRKYTRHHDQRYPDDLAKKKVQSGTPKTKAVRDASRITRDDGAMASSCSLPTRQCKGILAKGLKKWQDTTDVKWSYKFKKTIRWVWRICEGDGRRIWLWKNDQDESLRISRVPCDEEKERTGTQRIIDVE